MPERSFNHVIIAGHHDPSRNGVLATHVIDSIEQGHGADRGARELMKASGVYLVPTLSVVDAMVTKTPEQ